MPKLQNYEDLPWIFIYFYLTLLSALETFHHQHHLPADVPHVFNYGRGLYQPIDDGAHDDEAVIGADHDIPKIEKFHPLAQCQIPVIVPYQK